MNQLQTLRRALAHVEAHLQSTSDSDLTQNRFQIFDLFVQQLFFEFNQRAQQLFYKWYKV